MPFGSDGEISPLVSIIIPCYNAERWIADAINSCLAQTYRPIEIIVVDDGSTDGSLKIIQSYGDRIQYITGPNRGGSSARNRGFTLSKGKHVMFLDADDELLPDTIKALVQNLQSKNKTLAVCNWGHAVQSSDGWRLTLHNLKYDADYDYLAGWLEGNYIPCHAILWQREILQDLDGWDESLTYNDDADLAFRALTNGVHIIPTQGGLAIYKHYKDHMSVGKQLSSQAFKSGFRILEKLEASLSSQGKLSDYAVPLARAYHSLAVTGLAVDIELARECIKRSKILAGNKSVTGSLLHRILCYTIGLENKEKLARWLAAVGVARPMRRQTSRQNKTS